jgi:hypothetical protein
MAGEEEAPDWREGLFSALGVCLDVLALQFTATTRFPNVHIELALSSLTYFDLDQRT